MSGYENAPATRMLATHCACCRQPLLDARSVEVGMGPVCRKRHGYDAAKVSDEAREQANALISRIAVDPGEPENVARLATLTLLGFQKLVDVLADRLTAVKVMPAGGGMLSVRTPYREGFVSSVRTIRGRRWNREDKVWVVPEVQKGLLWSLIKQHFHGALGLGPAGMFVTP